MRGRIGAFALHSRHDSRETSAPGRAAAERRFLDLVDPDRELDEGERLRRAEHARRMHMAQLALASARKRAGKKLTTGPSTPVASEVDAGGAGRGSDKRSQSH